MIWLIITMMVTIISSLSASSNSLFQLTSVWFGWEIHFFPHWNSHSLLLIRRKNFSDFTESGISWRRQSSDRSGRCANFDKNDCANANTFRFGIWVNQLFCIRKSMWTFFTAIDRDSCSRTNHDYSIGMNERIEKTITADCQFRHLMHSIYFRFMWKHKFGSKINGMAREVGASTTKENACDEPKCNRLSSGVIVSKIFVRFSLLCSLRYFLQLQPSYTTFTHILFSLSIYFVYSLYNNFFIYFIPFQCLLFCSFFLHCSSASHRSQLIHLSVCLFVSV